jgi:hypothetical protein
MVQQNQLIDIYNNFRLLTNASWTSQNRWSTIGFYPDLVSEAGLATDNNIYAPANTTANNAATNSGLTERLSYIKIDFTGLSLGDIANSAVQNLTPETQIKQLYLSHISKIGVGAVIVSSPFVQYSVKATIMLKDIHPLFEVIPISKSLNFKIQVFWNNSAITATHSAAVVGVAADAATNTATVAAAAEGWSSQSAQYRAYNGTVPLMLNNWTTGFTGSTTNTTLRTSIYVGDTCYDSTQKSVAPGILTGAVGKQVELWVPAYQMLVDVDANYSEGHKKIITYNDYYQFSLKGVGPNSTFNHLVSNGISNLKACLIVPFLSSLNNNQFLLILINLILWSVVQMFFITIRDMVINNLIMNFSMNSAYWFWFN